MDGHDDRSDFPMERNAADIYVNGPPTGAERRLRQPEHDHDQIGRGTRARRQVRRYQPNEESHSDLISLDQTSRNGGRNHPGSLSRDRNARRQGLRQQIQQNQDFYDNAHDHSVDRAVGRRGTNRRDRASNNSRRRLRRQHDHHDSHISYRGRDEDSFDHADEYDDEDPIDLLDDESEPVRANRKLKQFEASAKDTQNNRKKLNKTEIELDDSAQEDKE